MGEGNKVLADFNDTLNHEKGHAEQLEELGLFDFTVAVAIPSVYYCQNEKELTNEGKYPYSSYYDAPWEHDADRNGQVNRTNPLTAPYADELSDNYFEVYSNLSMWEKISMVETYAQLTINQITNTSITDNRPVEYLGDAEWIKAPFRPQNVLEGYK